VPSYRLHKASGQAVVTFSRHDVYLGAHDSPESHALYKRKVAEWLAAGCRQPPPAGSALTVAELMAAYWAHAKTYYVKHGKPTGPQSRIRSTISIVNELYGDDPAVGFSPRALKVVREAMVAKGWKRSTVNQYTQLVVQSFAWAVEEELVAASVHHALMAVAPLRKGRTAAPESEKVDPAPETSIDAVRPVLTPMLSDVMDFQILTAARPGEALAVRPCDLDRESEVWLYRPRAFKTEHHEDAERVIYIGPRCQAILRRRWPAGEEEFFFSAAAAMEERSQALRAARKTPVPLSQQNRRARRRKRPWGKQYRVSSYQHAVARACERVGCEHFYPHQLRHNAGTRIRAEFGLEVAAVIMGHAHLSTAEIYAEQDLAAAVKAMKVVG
jgi:integrase